MDTCDGLFQNQAKELDIRILRNHLIIEKKPAEYTNPAMFKQRIDDVMTWLTHRPEKTIAFVSHGLFLRKMVNPDIYFQNCTVYRSELKIWKENGRTQHSWEKVRIAYQPDLVHREIVPENFLTPGLLSNDESNPFEDLDPSEMKFHEVNETYGNESVHRVNGVIEPNGVSEPIGVAEQTAEGFASAPLDSAGNEQSLLDDSDQEGAFGASPSDHPPSL